MTLTATLREEELYIIQTLFFIFNLTFIATNFFMIYPKMLILYYMPIYVLCTNIIRRIITCYNIIMLTCFKYH
jgi:hypothetical protein